MKVAFDGIHADDGLLRHAVSREGAGVTGGHLLLCYCPDDSQNFSGGSEMVSHKGLHPPKVLQFFAQFE